MTIVAGLAHRGLVQIGIERRVDVGDHLEPSPFELTPQLGRDGLDALDALLRGGVARVEHRQQRFGDPRPGLGREVAVALLGLLLEVGELRRDPLELVEVVVSLGRGGLERRDQLFDGERRSGLFAGIRRLLDHFLGRLVDGSCALVGGHSAASSSSMISASTTSSSSGVPASASAAWSAAAACSYRR